MKQLTSAIFILLFFATVIFSCNKKDEFQECLDNPECEYFRCNVDGKLWRPDCESAFLGCDAVDVQYYRDLNGGGLSIIASNDSDQTGFRLILHNINSTNVEYSFAINNSSFSWFYMKSDSTQKKYYAGLDDESFINFTQIDTINFIIEGTFEFTGINNDGESMEITDGKFRQHYRF